MLWPVLISGFTLGAAGSLHCIGMCGPLSLALPVHHLSKSQKTIYLFIYQLGRVVTYSLIGLIFGLAGRRIYISGYQQWFSIGLGIAVLLLAALYFFRSYTIHFGFLNRFYSAIQKMIGKILKNAGSPFSFLLMGLANGLLPCGLIYVAVAATLSFTEVFHSIIFMAMFGLGTLPAMMLVASAGQRLKVKTRELFRKAVPYFVVAMGLILIMRGLNLGIPFISPELPHAPGEAVVCHP